VRHRVLELARGALAAIEAHRGRIDDLNVYPVPDGDTGTNLTLTVQAIVVALESGRSDDRAGIAQEVTRAALMGARGNSGVILSQIVRGAAEAFTVSNDLGPALRRASDVAYGAVPTPVEGTILTAIRELAEEAESGGDLAAVLRRGDDCVVRTQALLPALTAAGVVDAGAAGLVEIVRGIAAAISGEALPAPDPGARVALTTDAIHLEPSRYRYCTVFVVEGEELDAPILESELAAFGDSLLVVGDPAALKVHVHTDDPGRALSLGTARGTIAGIEIANMHAQTAQREERLSHPPVEACAVVAVVAGDGNRALFESLGATVVDGGATMNPSTAEILAAIDAADGAEVIVLPNSGNVIMAAEAAAGSAARPTRVLPTTTLQAGLAALVAFTPSRAADANAAEMAGAASEIVTGAVTRASRDVESDGVTIRTGEWLGLVERRPVAGGSSFDEVTRVVLARLLDEPRGVLTFLTGAEPQPLDTILVELAETHPAVECDVHDGGQPHYTLLLSAE